MSVSDTNEVNDRTRIRGCLLGGAIGDALGAQVEFDSSDAIAERFGPDGPDRLGMTYGHDGGFTDDTQMLLFTAEGLLRAATRMREKGICDVPGVVHRAYLRWLHTQGELVPDLAGMSNGSVLDGWLVHEAAIAGPRAPGTSCLSSLRSGTMGTVADPINDSKGCGAIMRIAPVGVVSSTAASAFELGVELGAITHGNPSGYLPAGAFAAVIWSLLDGASMLDAFESAHEQLTGWSGHEETTGWLREAIDGAADGPATPNIIDALGRGGWWGSDALAITARVALASNDPIDALRRAVNHGGDSDSTGSLVGNLIGAHLGESALPSDWIDQLEGADVVATIADDLASTRAGEVPASWAFEKQPDGVFTAVNTNDPRADAWWARYPGW